MLQNSIDKILCYGLAVAICIVFFGGNKVVFGQDERGKVKGPDDIIIGLPGQKISKEDLDKNINVDAAFMHRVPDLLDLFDRRLSGHGVTVGLWDGGPVLHTHKAFGGRIISFPSGFHPNWHATHVAGTIGAAPVTEILEGRLAAGMASNVKIASYNICPIEEIDKVPMQLAAAFAKLPNMRVINHSWGIYPSNQNYFSLARDFDQLISNKPGLVMIVAAGNEGQSKHFHTLRSPGIARNVITVGAMVDLPPGQYVSETERAKITAFSKSSFGPTPDGRIKPDVIANGMELVSTSTYYPERANQICWPSSSPAHIDRCGTISHSNISECYQTITGTSMATPVTTGVVALLQELSKIKTNRWLLADDVKGLLIHSAISKDHLPSYKTGWGAYQANKAGLLVSEWSNRFKPNLDGRNFTRVKIGKKDTVFKIRRIRKDSHIRITLSWIARISDDDARGLANDLDVSLVRVGSSSGYLPWNLDPKFPNKKAFRAINKRDNVERIDVFPNEQFDGDWELRIRLSGHSGSAFSAALIVEGLCKVGTTQCR